MSGLQMPVGKRHPFQKALSPCSAGARLEGGHAATGLGTGLSRRAVHTCVLYREALSSCTDMSVER